MKSGRLDTTQEILFAPLRRYGTRYHALVFSLLAIVGWGVYAYYVQFTNGLGVTGMRNETSWGFYIENFVFLIGISHAGTLISAILRVANAEWRRPITRMAESITVMSILVAALFPLIDLGRPDRILNIFSLARLQSPLVWDFLCIGTYLTGSIIYLYLPMIPDIAQCRDNVQEASRFRKWFYSTLSLGWSGSEREEAKLKRAIKIMAVIIIPIAVSVHSIVSWDFAMTLRVEWHSTEFAPYFVGGAIFSGIATIIIMMAIFRKAFHLEPYLKHKHFTNLALMMLALNIIMIYLTISMKLVAGYGSEALDSSYLTSLFSGTYAPLFWFQIIGGLVVPAFLVGMRRTRRSIAWLVVASVFVDAGMWIERYLLITPSLAVPQLPYPVGLYTPSWTEISIVGAGFAAFALLLALFSRIFPVVSMWEVSEGETTGTKVELPTPELGSSLDRESLGGSLTRSVGGGKTRRQFLSLAAFSGAGMALGMVTVPMLGQNSSTPDTGAGAAKSSSQAATTVPLANLGKVITLDEARAAGFLVTTPTVIPPGSVIKEVRTAELGQRVALLYDGPGVEPLSLYGDRVTVAVFESPESVVSSAPEYLPEGFVRVDIDGSAGFAKEPTKTQSGAMEPGQIQWWKNGVHYSIFANVPVQYLRTMAASRWV